MKPKIFFFTLFLFLQSISLFPQCISIELSITWEMGYDILKKDSIISIPRLNITYRNDCDTNYYFFKICDNSPMISCGMLSHPDFDNFEEYIRWRKDYLARAKESIANVKKYHNYVKDYFNVRIGESPCCTNVWSILHDTVDTHNPFSFDVIGCRLRDVYKYIYYENNDEENEIFKLNFEPSDITPENISDSLKDKFVFLKSGEFYNDSYNLIGFKIVEGCFTFMIMQNEIENYVIDFNNEKLELPPLVGEYHRYSGAFNTNKVTVCFGEK